MRKGTVRRILLDIANVISTSSAVKSQTALEALELVEVFRASEGSVPATEASAATGCGNESEEL
jgi:hypothetical protein